MSERLVSTYSMWSLFRNCRKAAHWRYVLELVPLERDRNLTFGSLIHQCLEIWHGTRDLQLALDHIDRECVDRARDEDQRRTWHYATAMMRGYAARYPTEDFEVVALEKTFTGEIVNPATGASSRSFVLSGRVDGIVRIGERHYLLEHKCLTGDSRIFDYGSGRLMRVEDMVRDGVAPLVLGYDVTSRELRLAQATVPQPESVRPTCTVTLRSGRTLRVSENHPIWTRRGWVPAGELTQDDRVGVPARTGGRNLPESPLTDHEIRFIGYMLGDGCFSNMTFTKTDAAVRADFRAALDGMGAAHRLHLSRDRAPYVRVEQARSGAAAALCERLELTGLAADKHVPDEVFGATDVQIGLLLGALWSTDGCINVSREQRAEWEPQDKIRIAYCSRSRRLCDDIQRLLLRLGLWSTVTTSSVAYNGERRPYFTTKVVGREMKRRFLHAVLDGSIPMLRSRDDARRALAAIKPGDHERDVVAQDGLFWDRVASVEVGPESLMYDLSVPGLHTFVVDDVVTHNTAGVLDSGYLERLWTDFQITLYAHYVEQALGIRISGVLYNILVKARLQQSVGESESEFEARRAELIAKSKSGKSSAKRRMPESDEAYQARLATKYAEPGMFHREPIFISRDRFEALRAELWELTQAFLDARRRGVFYENTSQCFQYGRPCPYFALCRSGGSETVMENLYQRVAPHEELRDDEGAQIAEALPF